MGIHSMSVMTRRCTTVRDSDYISDYTYIILLYIRLEVTSRWRPFGPLDFIFCALWCIIWVGGGEDERLECQWLVVDISFHKMYDEMRCYRCRTMNNNKWTRLVFCERLSLAKNPSSYLLYCCIH